MTATPRRKAELILPLVMLAGLLYLTVAASKSFFPFILSVALAYLLNPIIVFFESRGFKRVHVVSALYLFVGVGVILLTISLLTALIDELGLLRDQWPVYMAKFQHFYGMFEERFAAKAPFLKQTLDTWSASAGTKLTGMLEAVPALMMKLVPFFTVMALVPFITFFMLIDGGKMIDAMLDIIPSKYVEIVLHVVCEIDQSLGNYLRGILLESTMLFALALIGLSFMGLEYAGAVAVAMGISSMIPYLGPVVGAVCGAVAAFVQFSTVDSVIQVLVFFVFLRFIDDWFLQPIILKRAVQVHPVIIVFALLAGAELFGVWGVIFAMPVTCILKVFLSIAMELQRTEFAWKPKPEPTRISIPYV